MVLPVQAEQLVISDIVSITSNETPPAHAGGIVLYELKFGNHKLHKPNGQVAYTIGKDGNPVYGFSPVSGLCFGDSPPSGCEQTEEVGPRWSCHSYNFKAGYIYEVSATTNNW